MIEIKNLLQYRNDGREVETRRALPRSKAIRFLAETPGEFTYHEIAARLGIHHRSVEQACREYRHLLTIYRVPREGYRHHGHFRGGKPVPLVSFKNQ